MPRIIVERNIEVPMRDGCVLRADLFRPDTSDKLPVLLNRTPYNKAMPSVFTGTLDALRAAEAGYNVVVQDCRGRFASAGVWNCFTDEARDGYDTIEWAARQSWANGNVGTYGASYMGATLDMWSTSNVFKQGHRIRLEVSSSNFPRFDRNPNTGHELFTDIEMRPAMQTVMHDRGFASQLTLPVIPMKR
ncbi:MAG TPA: CocE/NonD family hydrolase [Candidatus Acidoferrum sp.]|nr:CocE/NonD family hydrolase [Candidatus Acidoferrum sp.]